MGVGVCMRISPFALNILLLEESTSFLLRNTSTPRTTFKSRVHYDPGIKICNDNIPTSAGTEGVIQFHNFPLSEHYLSSGIKVEELLVFPSNLPPHPFLRKYDLSKLNFYTKVALLFRELCQRRKHAKRSLVKDGVIRFSSSCSKDWAMAMNLLISKLEER
ncbi:hypothetical protein CDAR_26431 [Caerostris darwini]|uniref:Uncharacterized protein n=1 Tax=Caerostris darwini TaxID=1538125 RepID=A0AAV4QFS9_9ARAC|nr:hypothetical protein CDAR_26431 [Caerostris darwini]